MQAAAFGFLRRSLGAMWMNYVAFRKVVLTRAAYAVGMPIFRLQYVDLFSGNILRARDFQAASDEAAIAYAEEARGLTAMELWQGDRKIKQWGAFPPIE